MTLEEVVSSTHVLYTVIYLDDNIILRLSLTPQASPTLNNEQVIIGSLIYEIGHLRAEIEYAQITTVYLDQGHVNTQYIGLVYRIDPPMREAFYEAGMTQY